MAKNHVQRLVVGPFTTWDTRSLVEKLQQKSIEFELYEDRQSLSVQERHWNSSFHHPNQGPQYSPLFIYLIIDQDSYLDFKNELGPYGVADPQSYAEFFTDHDEELVHTELAEDEGVYLCPICGFSPEHQTGSSVDYFEANSNLRCEKHDVTLVRSDQLKRKKQLRSKRHDRVLLLATLFAGAFLIYIKFLYD